jgi:tetratricopeptide (TPR) repeat protein
MDLRSSVSPCPSGSDPQDLESIVELFELEWQRGEPRLDDFLSRHGGGVERRRVLIELSLIDMEYRLKRGDTVVIDPYAVRFPDEDLKRAFVQEATRLVMAVGRRRVVGDERPRRIGEYELLDPIAKGGMGVVFRARQPRLGRIVALKMIRHMDAVSAEEVRRFQGEAQAIAKLEHRFIVPIHEVGQEGGRHFFSMSLVEGGSLADRLAAGPIDRRAAVVLLQRVTEAIAFAHSKGIIHRDLKPSNILMAADGTPRVTDFGLAKRVNDSDDLTRTGEPIGTAPYMSPEQARGDVRAIGPESDIYSLGAILYEMLTGRPPFMAASLVATLDQVAHLEPVPPSQLNPVIERDLETICLKCLRKEKQRRYSTAGQLADDLSSWLEGKPINARPVSRAERAWLWSARNRFLAGLLAAVCFLTVAVALGSSVAAVLLRAAWENERNERLVAEAARVRAEASEREERRQLEAARIAQCNAQAEEQRARREAATATRIADFLTSIFQSADPYGLEGIGFRTGPEEQVSRISARDILERAAERIPRELAAEPVVQARLMDTVGEVCRTCGLYGQAEFLLEQALDVKRRSLPAGHLDIAQACHHLGSLRHDQARYQEAEALFREALTIRTAHHDSFHLDVAATKFHLAWALANRGALTEAEVLFRDVMEIRKARLDPSHQDLTLAVFAITAVRTAIDQNPEAMARAIVDASVSLSGRSMATFALGLFEHQLAVLRRRQQNYPEADRHYRRVLLTVQETFGNELNLPAALLRGDYAGMLRESGDYAEAEAQVRQAIAIGGRLFHCHPQTVHAEYELAKLVFDRGGYEEAEQLLDSAMERLRTGGQSRSCAAGLALRLRGEAAAARGDQQRATRFYLEARDILVECLGSEHAETVTCDVRLGDALSSVGLAEEAERVVGPWARQGDARALVGVFRSCQRAGTPERISEALDAIRGLATELAGRDVSGSVADLQPVVEVLLLAGRHVEAVALCRRLVEDVRQTRPRDHPVIGDAIGLLVTCLSAAGLHSEALPEARTMTAIFAKRFGDDHPLTLRGRIDTAIALAGTGDTAAAIAVTREAMPALRTAVGAFHPWVARGCHDMARMLRMNADPEDHAILEEARELAREAYETRLQMYGDRDYRVAESAEEATTIHELVCQVPSVTP